MAIIGAILGDIAGSRWEFGRPKDLDWKHIDLFTDDCFFTDDSVLTVATKYALQNNISFGAAYHKFGNTYPDCSYGCGFRSWLGSKWSKPYNSIGNGAAMRVSPVVDSATSYEQVINRAISSAECTHNHPEGIKGATVTAVCAWLSKVGASKGEIEEYASKQYTKADYQFPVSMSLAELRKKYIYGTKPVKAACR